MKHKKILLSLLALMLAACNGTQTNDEPYISPPTSVESPDTSGSGGENNPISFNPKDLDLVDTFKDLTFKEPLALTHNERDDDLVYIVERHGLVYEVSLSTSDKKTVYLDLSAVIDTSGQEMGLLGLAFHPQYRDNGYLFVNYTKDGKTFISRFTSTGEDKVSLSTEKVLLTYEQPFSNHNGGTILFGDDGYLYIASGDGGSGGDPNNNAQNLESYLGKLLRIDVDIEDKPYTIPEGNPFAKDGGNILKEIYAYGLRNPWKFSFDSKRDLLIAADVGQGEIEEIDLIVSGGNYGWNLFEGTRPYKEDVTLEDHIPPIYEYPHSEGRSITGGYTYYGNDLPSLNGAYLYGDFISGTIWALWLDRELIPTNYHILDTDLMISSFGLDRLGEIYVLDFNGKIYTLEEKE